MIREYEIREYEAHGTLRRAGGAREVCTLSWCSGGRYDSEQRGK